MQTGENTNAFRALNTICQSLSLCWVSSTSCTFCNYSKCCPTLEKFVFSFIHKIGGLGHGPPQCSTLIATHILIPFPLIQRIRHPPPSPQAVPLAPCNCIWLVIPSRKYLQLLPLWLLHLRKKHKSLPFRDLSFDSALLCGWCTISFLFEQNFLIVESWTSDSTSSPPIHLSAYRSQPPAHESFANFLKVSSDYLNCQI